VLVQLGFVYQQQGKNEDALNLYTAALKSKYVATDVITLRPTAR
jgi:hypothetical protein